MDFATNKSKSYSHFMYVDSIIHIKIFQTSCKLTIKSVLLLYHPSFYRYFERYNWLRKELK